jgi:hypothetical protein
MKQKAKASKQKRFLGFVRDGMWPKIESCAKRRNYVKRYSAFGTRREPAFMISLKEQKNAPRQVPPCGPEFS